MMSSEAMVSFLRKVAPGVEQSLQQNETVDIFQVFYVARDIITYACRCHQGEICILSSIETKSTLHVCGKLLCIYSSITQDGTGGGVPEPRQD